MGLIEKERTSLTSSIMVGDITFTWDEAEEIRLDTKPQEKLPAETSEQPNSAQNNTGNLPQE